jgi:hypothetical protein
MYSDGACIRCEAACERSNWSEIEDFWFGHILSTKRMKKDEKAIVFGEKYLAEKWIHCMRLNMANKFNTSVKYFFASFPVAVIATIKCRVVKCHRVIV